MTCALLAVCVSSQPLMTALDVIIVPQKDAPYCDVKFPPKAAAACSVCCAAGEPVARVKI